MSGALKSVFGGGNIFGALLSVASVFFPPLAIAGSLSNLLTTAIGEAVKMAASQLVKQFAMPKFLEGIIGQVVDAVVSKLTGQNKTDPEVDNFVGNDEGVRDTMQNFTKELTDKIIESTRKQLDKESEEKSGSAKGGKGGKTAISAGSWLQAIAIAMGEIAGDKAAQMVELSKKMSDLNGTGKELTGQLEATGKKDTKAQQEISAKQQDNAREFSVVQAQFQATSQEFSILQNTFSNALKSIGEGLTTMGRKG